MEDDNETTNDNAKATVTATPSTEEMPDNLLGILGIDASQLTEDDATEITEDDSKTPNKKAIKDKAKKSIRAINENNGKNIRFHCIKTDGYMKDANGSIVTNKDGKKVRQYKKVTKEGFYVVDDMEKTVDGKKVNYYTVSKMIQYTDSEDCTSFKEIG